jgi:Uma2 family endonuclease
VYFTAELNVMPIVEMLTEKTHLTPAEYLALERQSQERHEYYGGELRLMAGASRKHNIISLNIASFLKEKLRGKPCRPFMSDMRVRIASAQRYFYPDIAVICGAEAFVEEDIATDATVIIEVLSDSTEALDRGEKFESYQCLPSLQDYVLVSQNKMRLEHFHKLAQNEWQYAVLNQPNEVLRLDALGVQIPLKEIYADVELNPT